MPRFQDIINPPTEQTSKDPEQLYRNMDSVYQFLDGMITISNPTQTINADFKTLSGVGLTPTTQAQGDDFEFIGNWFVVGATVADYTLTPTPYPTNSGVVSASPYFVNVAVTSYASGTGLSFYQKQSGLVRKFQTQFVTMTISATNNTTTVTTLRFSISLNLDPGDILLEGGILYLKPGYNVISTTLKTPTLRDETVGAAAYAQFNLDFVNFAAVENFDIYSIKAEFGKISTPLN